MSFQDFFRGFMGLNPRYDRYGNDGDPPVNKFRNPPWGDEPNEDDDFDELYSDYRSGPSNSFGFNIFTGDIMQMHKYFEEQMNEMMRSFGSFGFGGLDFDSGSGSSELPDSNAKRDVRDRYLKAHDDQPQPQFDNNDRRADSDIDDRVNTDGIGTLFKKEPTAVEPLIPQTPRTFRHSYTSRIIINNNGRVEERVKEWTSDGVEKESVRRTVGDQTHSVTTSKDKEGQLRTEEELINIDQGSLNDFDEKWTPQTNQVLPPGPRDGTPSILSPLFRFLETIT